MERLSASVILIVLVHSQTEKPRSLVRSLKILASGAQGDTVAYNT